MLKLNIFFSLGLLDLPKDYRALMHTPRTINISSAAGGEFWYNGIAVNLRNIFRDSKENQTICLSFNMDGLPISKSSKKHFWPILSTIHSNFYS